MTFTPSALERDDLALGRDLRAVGAEAEHARDRVAPHVGVEHADRLPSAASAAARLAVSVDLPTPPLPEPTQMTFATCASAPVGQAAAAELLLQRALLLVGEHVEVDVDAGDALERADGLRDAGLEVAADRAARASSATR